MRAAEDTIQANARENTVGGASATRLDVQALRAAAVTGVVAFHFWPAVMPGGFAGVDAFFVVSGFLVGGALVREARSAGRIDFWRFAWRRTRRLLPAALAVIAVIAIVAFVVYSPLDLLIHGTPWKRPSVTKDALASLGGFSNIWFDAQERRYDDALLSPFTHFWSLAVELQFYVVMPLLALLIGAAARRGPRVLGLATAAIALLLFDLMLVADFVFDTPMFFNPLARLWEFFAGVLVALAAGVLAVRWTRGKGVAAALGWLALLAFFVVGASVRDWPNALTLWPLAATALIIAADAQGGWGSKMVRSRPVQAVGDASYSIYLVHWPVLVVWIALVNRPLSFVESIGALVITAALSLALYRWVEQRWRRAPIGTRTDRLRLGRRLAMAAALTLLIPIASALVAHERASVLGDIAPAYVLGPVGTGGNVGAHHLPGNVRPLLLEARDDMPSTSEWCNVESGEMDNFDEPCLLGTATEAEPLVLLIGDSHAQQWVDALRGGAEAGRYRFAVVTADGCSLITGIGGRKTPEECDAWRDWAMGEVRRLNPDVIVASSRLTYSRAAEQVPASELAEGLRKGLAALPSQARLVWIADTPLFPHEPLDCIVKHPLDLGKCAVARDIAVHEELAAPVRDVVVDAGGRWVDFTDYFCDDACPVVFADILAYRDDDHISATFARELSDVVETRLGLTSAGEG